MEGNGGPVQRVLELFATDLADVRFGDVDAATLGRLAADAESASAVVAAALSALDAAQGALKERQRVLLEYAQRALAYARVYAENDDGLTARLEAIALPRLARRVRPSDDSLVLSPGPAPVPRQGRRLRKEPAIDGATAAVSLEDQGAAGSSSG